MFPLLPPPFAPPALTGLAPAPPWPGLRPCLQGHEGKFSLYVHATPGFEYNRSEPGAALFADRLLPHPARVEWGQMSVVDAERRLMAAALLDPRNERFVLLSESCLPLRPFQFVQRYLLGSSRSFLDMFPDDQWRYRWEMAAEGVPAEAWRKGTQWCALTREHAALFVADQWVFDVFERHCVTEYNEAGGFGRFCAGDEHYKQTLLVLHGREAEAERRQVTWANWRPLGRAHPKLYAVQEVDEALVRELQGMRAAPHPAEEVPCGEWDDPETGEPGAPRPCWLFARKFTPRGADRILTFSREVIGF